MADIYASNWNEDDASNNQTPPDGFPEGMAPSGVNNGVRAIMGATKRFVDQQIPKTTAGSATAYTLTYGVAPGAYVDGMTFMVQFHASNGVAATLNVNLLGAKPLHYHAAQQWRVAPPGLVDTDEIFRVAYHDGTGAFRLIGFRNGTGETREFAGSVAPAGSLLCNGLAVSRTTYAGLFAVIGINYGSGDGSTTFNLPDHRGRVVAGSDVGVGRLSGVPGLASAGLGGAGGTPTQIFAVSGSAAGGISITGNTDIPFGDQTNVNIAGGGAATGTGHIHNLAGSGFANLSVSGVTDTRSVTQPTIIENKIIRI